MAVKPLLIIAWGNRSRGDDAVGPLFLDALRQPPPVTLLGLHAERFGLGRPPSEAATEALPAAVLWALGWIDAD
ncbi:MAG: hypothetical protein IPI03_20170 [Rubrivivax sp.]|nr:hypothetical protein [Rubrivivax sp.]